MSEKAAGSFSRRFSWVLMPALAVTAGIVAVDFAYARQAAQTGAAAPAASNPEKKSMAAFEVYADKAGEYRWRLRAQNSQILATSSEGYKEKRSCLSAIESVKAYAALAPVEEKPAQ